MLSFLNPMVEINPRNNLIFILVIDVSILNYFDEELSREGSCKKLFARKKNLSRYKFRKGKTRFIGDKIMDNRFNSGEILYNELPDPVIESSYKSDILNCNYNSYEYYRIEKLNKTIVDIYKGTTWFDMYKGRKKIPKSELSEVYTYIKERIKDSTYSNTEVFTAIAFCLDINIKTLFYIIGTAYTQEIIEELKKYKPNIIEKHTAPLF